MEAVIYQSHKKFLKITTAVAGGTPRKMMDNGVVAVPVLQERIKEVMTKALIDTAKSWEEKSPQGQLQAPAEGRTYFAMPYCLRSYAEKKLRSYLVKKKETAS